MKYGLSLLLGIVTGAVIFCLLLYFNPFAGGQAISPLAITDSRLLGLTFSSVPDETLILTNDGESVPAPYPAKVLQLWEPTIAHTSAMVVMLANSRGEPAGVGIKIWSESETTDILNAALMVDSIWHVILPGKGTFLVDQQENYWSYMREVVIPAHRSSGDNWRGTWNGVMTVGPNALGTARVTGGSGDFAGIATEAVESRLASAFSVAKGPVAMRGSLTIMLPDEAVDDEVESE